MTELERFFLERALLVIFMLILAGVIAYFVAVFEWPFRKKVAQK